MIRENAGPTKVPLTELLLTVMILGMGNLPLDRRSYFFIQNYTFFSSFNRKMLSGYCLENSQSF